MSKEPKKSMFFMVDLSVHTAMKTLAAYKGMTMTQLLLDMFNKYKKDAGISS